MIFCSWVMISVLPKRRGRALRTPTTPRPASAFASAMTPTVRLSPNYCRYASDRVRAALRTTPRAPRSPCCGAARRRAPSFFARNLATLEEPPERADGDGDAARPQLLPQFRKRNVALGGHGRKDQLGMRLDPLRMAVPALELGPDIALAPFHGPPPDGARGADAKPLRRRPTRQSALDRPN